MQIPVLIEPTAADGYSARTGEPLPLHAVGATQEEALAKLQVQLNGRLTNGTRLTSLESAPPPHPLAEFAGIYSPDDPLVQDWLEIIAENRR